MEKNNQNVEIKYKKSIEGEIYKYYKDLFSNKHTDSLNIESFLSFCFLPKIVWYPKKMQWKG